MKLLDKSVQLDAKGAFWIAIINFVIKDEHGQQNTKSTWGWLPCVFAAVGMHE